MKKSKIIINKFSKLYFVGIKGVGMANLAIMAKQAGIVVGGSDTADEFITDQELLAAGISPRLGFQKKNIEEFVAGTNHSNILAVTTAAHDGQDNLEAIYAKELGIQVVSYGKALGMMMNGEIINKKFIGISVAGTHGKTTTSALIAHALTKLSSDPSYVIGTSAIFPDGAAAHFGHGKYLVAEADEYVSDLKYDVTSKFLYQHPQYLIITNIDFDHPDVFESIVETTNTFREFTKNLSENGVIIANSVDKNVKILLSQISNNILTFGKNEGNFQITQFQENGVLSYFTVKKDHKLYGKFKLQIPGFHNTLNALAAIALLDTLGFNPDDISYALSTFIGTKRRLEKIGKTITGVLIIDDYAHHPEEIESSLIALRGAYPDKKIIVVFQPHMFSRTQSLLSQFSKALRIADHAIVLPIYKSAREKYSENDCNHLSQNLISKTPNAVFLKDSASVVKYIGQKADLETLVVTMGAGDVYHIAEQLVNLKV